MVRKQRSFWTRLSDRLHRSYLAATVPTASHAPWQPGDPVAVAGMFRTASGIGESARLSYHALSERGCNPQAVDVSDLFGPIDLTATIPLSGMPENDRGLLLLHMNSPETVQSLHYLGRAQFRNWRVVGAWAWELERLPESWSNGFKYVDEIWALSTFTAEAIKKSGDVPVRVVVPPVRVPKTTVPRRGDFGIDPDVFTVLASTDILSSPLRKNPLGALDAFLRAFPNDNSAQLVLKLRNLDRDDVFRRQLLERVSEVANVKVIERVLKREEMFSLLKCADVLISLHRSEGLGLPLAEAMLIGVPTVATAWSGNMDFMDKSSAILVPYELRPVPTVDPFYGKVPGAVWAEPDIDVAAAELRALKNSPRRRESIVKHASIAARRHFSSERYLETAGFRTPM